MSNLEITQADVAAAKACWNALADADNDWDALSVDEQVAISESFARHRIAEREACAMVAENYGGDYESTTSPVCWTRRNIAAAIRARSDRVDDISYAGVGP